MLKRALSLLSLSLISLTLSAGCGVDDPAVDDGAPSAAAGRAALSTSGQSIRTPSGTTFISDPVHHVVYRQISFNDPLVIIAGASNQPGYVDGAAAASRLNTPNGLAYDAAQNVLYVADVGNRAVRKIVLGGSRTVTTAVTSAQAVSAGLAAGFASVSSLGVRGVGVGQSGRLYITDSTNQVVWMKPANSTLRLHAGSPGLSGNNDGVGTAARFFNPDLIAVSANGGLVTVSEPDRCRVRLIETGGQVSTLSSGGC